jgi:hypothetical protein
MLRAMWSQPAVLSVDSSPKWFTEINLDLRQGWVESTIAPVPTLVYDDTAFTRVEFSHPEAPFIPGPTPAA